MIRDHPLLGVGPDNFLSWYRDRYIRPEAWQEPNLSHPHNVVLDLWLSTGLLGLFAISWAIVRFFRVGLALYRALDSQAHRGMTLGLMAMMVDFVAHGMVDNSLFLADLALVFWLGCAILEVLRQEHYNKPSVL
jgi:O-antigen ligase